MIHARQDYNRIQDPKGRIPEDEPVFLLRGQDKLAPGILRSYASMTRVIGGSEEIADKVEEHAKLMGEWQANNKSKIADLPNKSAKKGVKRDPNKVSRASNLVYNVPSEIKLREAIHEIEKLPGDTRLTQAINLVSNALDIVNKFVNEEFEENMF